MSLGVVGGDVGGGEEAPLVAHLARPPVLVGLIGHRDNVAPSELQLAEFLGRKVVQRLHQRLHRVEVNKSYEKNSKVKTQNFV